MLSSEIRSERSRSAVADRPGTPAGFVPHLVCNWPRVVIREVRVIPSRLSDESHSTVRAWIHLGALLPVDVRVAMVPTRGSVPNATQTRLMLSAESSHNGSHLFEGTMPAAALGEGCTVRVTPALDLPVWRDLLRAIEASGRPVEVERVIARLSAPVHALP
jgi:hypothetical protein